MDLDWINGHLPEIKNFVARNAVTTLSHPLEYGRTLMQLGYEPFAPIESTSLFLRQKYLALPNIFTYAKHLKSVDGFVGCYRGLFPRLIETNVYYWVNLKMNDIFPQKFQHDKFKTEDEDDSSMRIGRKSRVSSRVFQNNLVRQIPDEVFAFLKTTGGNVVNQCIAVTVAYPFHVIALRTMAQFVGRETTYDNIFDGILEIYRVEGIFGFFKGLFPRLCYETMTVILTGTCLFFIRKYITKEASYATALVGSGVANSFAYPYLLVSNVFAVNDSRLALGYPPYAAKVFCNWYDCWTTLRAQSELTRGSSMFGRYTVDKFRKTHL